jgi:hypothetical protein
MRKTLLQKKEYVPMGTSEQFMVPLLRDEIESFFEQFANAESVHGHKALDVGCGRQPFKELIKRLGFNYNSVDAVQNMEGTVDYIEEIDGQLSSKIVENGPYDIMICTEVLEHVANWDGAFRNLNALLAVNGKLLITCPHFFGLHEAPYDFWRPTYHALQYYAAKYNFAEVYSKQVGGAWEVLGTLLGANTIRSWDKKFFNRLRAYIGRKISNMVFKSLAKGKIQKKLKFESSYQPTYLSNVMVLTKK